MGESICGWVCVLPDEADIVRGFVKVGGGSGLLSMMVPKAKRSYFTRGINSLMFL